MSTAALTPPAGLPALGPERAVVWPRRLTLRLSNGLQVVLAEAHGVPKLAVELIVRSGNAVTAQSAPGLAEMVAATVRTGTSRRSRRQIEEDLRRMGGDLSTSAGADSSIIAADGLAEAAEPLVELVAEVALDAVFPAGEFERERRRRLEELRIERVTPRFLASERLRRELFGAHPYAVIAPSEEQVLAYQLDRVREFYRRHYVASNALLLAVGDFSAERMIEQVDRAFRGWKAAQVVAIEEPALEGWRGRKVHVVHVPGAVQAHIVVGNRAITRQHPDWIRLVTANALYGGAFNSRLIANIREQKGYSYSPHSQAHALRRQGWFTTQAAVRNQVVAATLAEMFYEMDRLRALPPGAEELTETQNYLCGVFSLGVASQSGLRGQLATVYSQELPEDYLETFRERVRQVSPEDVLAVARQWIDSANALIVVAGDREQVAPQAELFGEMKVWETEEKSAADLAPAASGE
ncbi:MAG TPA: pitrilysin family protein [Candidatus Acidoferrales bacterium]|nr:pitrilysin family protein [Candidatus Acidoferrales bacterium]